ncbi:hypothetical protein GCM10010080_30640 [Thermomonas carbonis]|nr:hypothetical protein GCM10010080_30640 [Thermomonas carbonis]
MNSFYPALTPELSRTAARNGGVVHVTMQPTAVRWFNANKSHSNIAATEALSK